MCCCAAGEILILNNVTIIQQGLGGSMSTHHVLQGIAILYTFTILQHGLGGSLRTSPALQGRDFDPVQLLQFNLCWPRR